jgi:acetyltransferase-like isoleucine patch superfamily enzyme
MNLVKKLILKVVDNIEVLKIERHRERIASLKNIEPNVSIAKDTVVDGNIHIGANTCINNFGRIVSGQNSTVKIGQNCAIGRFFSCASRTHDLKCPTATDKYRPHLRTEKDIIIGNNVWIGDKVTIREGVTIADFSIIGANSVVTKDVEKFEIVGGVPAQHIRYNKEHYLYNDDKKG